MVICFISTKYGRKPAMILTQVLMGVGYFCSITDIFYLFLFADWMINFGWSGLFQVCYVYVAEMTGFDGRPFERIKWITYNSLIMETFLIPFLLGEIIVVSVLHLTVTRLHWTSFFLGAISFSLLLLLFHMTESPKWLLNNYKLKQSEKVLNEMAVANGKGITIEVDMVKGSSKVDPDGALVHEDIVRVKVAGSQPISLETKEYSIFKLFDLNLLPVSSITQMFLHHVTVHCFSTQSPCSSSGLSFQCWIQLWSWVSLRPETRDPGPGALKFFVRSSASSSRCLWKGSWVGASV